MTDSTVLLAPSIQDMTVDELFQTHLVRLIQRIYSEYTSQVSKAKRDLHTLVGEKYRDLIRIAEDVDKMCGESLSVDARLSDLSYRRSTHVQFGSSAASRFASKSRSIQAEQARNLLQTTILNNIINNKIIGFDLKLKTNSVPSTAALVHFAKLYHTVSSVFQQTFDSHPHILANYTRLRANFIAFLEKRLASSSFDSDDGDLASAKLLLRPSASWVELDALDLFDESFDEEDYEESSDWDSLGQQSSGYAVQSLPIVNILVAYIIVTSNDKQLNSTSKLAEHLIDLRFQYFVQQLDEFATGDRSQLENVNFFLIFSYIEKTCRMIQNHLIGDNFRNINSRLNGLKTWSPVDLIGFHNWLDTKVVQFPLENYSALDEDYFGLSKSSLAGFGSHLQTFMTRILVSLTSKDSNEPTSKLKLLYNSIASLRKVELLSSQNDTAAVSVLYFSHIHLASTFMKEILASVEQYVKEKQSELTTDISTLLAIPPAASRNSEPFTLDFVNSIDIDISNYIQTVIEIASLNDSLNSHSTSVSTLCKLKRWFYSQRSLLELFSAKSDIREKIQSVFTKSFRDGPTFDGWGDFSQAQVEQSFETLSANLKKSVVDCLLSFKQSLSESLLSIPDHNPVDSVQFLLSVILILRKNISVLNLPDSGVLLDFEEDACSLYDKIFEALLPEEESGNQFFTALSKPMYVSQTSEGATLPSGPHMYVYSFMSELASRMFKSSLFSEGELYTLYSDDEVRSIFVNTKNKWIMRRLLGNLSLDQLKLVPGQEDSTLEESKEPGEVTDDLTLGVQKLTDEVSSTAEDGDTAGVLQSFPARQLLANVAFVLQFTLGDEKLTANEHFVTFSEKLMQISEGGSLDEASIENILRSVSNFYQSGRETYMPLLLK